MSASSQPPLRARIGEWHGDVFGNATEPLLLIFSFIVLICILSGKWWIMGYAIGLILLYIVVLMYAVYLEYNAKEYLEQQAMSDARTRRAAGRGPRL